MTDPMTVAIATAAAGKAVELAGEPIRNAAAALVRLVRGRFGGDAEAEEALERAAEEPRSPERLAALAHALHRLRAEDPAFDRTVDRLWSQVSQTQTRVGDDGVSNVMNGNVGGAFVQVRDVNGDLTIS
ncbi:hypothetical protein [Actinomadura atramentaria]|uniref:hypothetical protein n=1 Tax=Actinomadura atramentaria TaxID=1990 RepID=UPI00036F5FE2|nr:hypothetical protein [Actinomadura atramentaria]